LVKSKADPAAGGARDEIVAFLPRLRRFCLAVTRSADAADDLLQSTVERALSRLDQWQEGTRLDSWMFRIAQNIHIDQSRSLRTRGVKVDADDAYGLSGDDGRNVVEARSDLAAARRAIARLPDDQRSLFALVVLDGLSYKDAADIMNIPIGTVMSRIARARRAIDEFVHGTKVLTP
jgi:RNA polymerase sigma-70 factor (ECF subfamily)